MVESKLLEIDELTNGDCFGDYSSILKEPIKYSVVTVIPCEVFACHISHFMLLGRNFAESFLRFSKLMPLDFDLRKALIEMQKWKQYKAEVIRSVKANQVNTRHNFDSQLRQPAQVPMKIQDRAAKSTFPTDEYLFNVQDLQALDSRIEPNYLSTYEFFLANKQRKNNDIQEK